MTKRLRIGFVGCGAFATQSLWPSLRYARVDIAHAYSRRLEKASEVARRYGAEHATDRLEDLLEDGSVDALFVVGPPHMQHEVGLRALDAGKHLFIEKPPAPDLHGAQELAQAASEAGVQVQVGFQKRFALGYQMAHQAVAAPEFGGLRLLKVNYSHWRVRDWRHHLAIMSVHGTDLARFFLGDPAEVQLLKRSDEGGMNLLALTLSYDSGAAAILNLSATDPHVQEWVELSGAGQLISVRNQVEYRHWRAAPDPADSMRPDPEAVSMWQPDFAIPAQQADSLWLQGYAGEVVAFVDALLEQRPVTPSISDGVAAMKLVEAVDAAPDGFSEISMGGARQ